MTKNCIKQVKRLYKESEDFQDLSVEQLLYAAIVGTDYEEVKTVLETTNWSKYCKRETGEMVKHYCPALKW